MAEKIKLGILTLDRKYALIKGNVACAESYKYPVCIRVIKNLFNPPKPISKSSVAVYSEKVNLFIDNALYLQAIGVKAIIASCGFFSLIQKEVSRHLSIPIFTSPLMLLPLFLTSLNKGKKICVVTLYDKALTNEYFAQVGLEEISRIVMTDMHNAHEFRAMIENDLSTVNFDLIENEIISAIDLSLKNNQDIGMILLECSDMPPFTESIKKTFNLPTFDYFSMIEMVYKSL